VKTAKLRRTPAIANARRDELGRSEFLAENSRSTSDGSSSRAANANHGIDRTGHQAANCRYRESSNLKGGE